MNIPKTGIMSKFNNVKIVLLVFKNAVVNLWVLYDLNYMLISSRRNTSGISYYIVQ